MSSAEMNYHDFGRVGHDFSVRQKLWDSFVLLFLSANVAVRLSILFQYPIVLQGIILITLFGCFFLFVYPRFCKAFLFLFACSLPWYGSHSYHIHNIVFELFLSVFAVIYLVQKRQQTKFVSINNKLALLVGCYILLACFSLLLLPLSHIGSILHLWGYLDFSVAVLQAPPESVLYPLAAVNRLLLFFVFIFQISTHYDNNRLYRIVFSGLVSGAVVAAFLGILNHYQWLPLDWFRDTVASGTRLQSVFGNPGWFAEFLAISIPFILIGFLNPKIYRITKLMLFGVLIICEMAIILTYSRTGWLIYPLVLVSCWFVFYLSRKIEAGTLSWSAVGKTSIKVIVSVPLTIIVSYFLVTGIVQRDDSGTASLLQQRFSKISNPAARKKIWQESIAIGLEAPIFGLGYESYKHQVLTLASIPGSLYSKKRQIQNIDFDTPHNHYLQIFVSNGIVGLFFWMSIVLYAVVILFYDLKTNKHYFNIAVLLSIIAFHQYGLAQSMQYVGVIWFVIFLCFGYTMTLNEQSLPPAMRQTVTVIALFLSFLTVAGGIVYAGNFKSRKLADKYGLHLYGADQDIDRYLGFYQRENWGKRGIFRWTGRRAIMKLERTGVMKIDFSCGTPELSSNPVVLDVSRNGHPIDQITFWNNRQVTRKYYIPPAKGSFGNQFEFQVSRTWIPRHEGGSNDSRMLGVAVSEPKILPLASGDVLGFYKWQMIPDSGEGKKNRLLKYRWTLQEAVLDLTSHEEHSAALLLKSWQPYIEKYPVEVEFFQQNNRIDSIKLLDHGWKRIAFSHPLNPDTPLILRVNRTWNPMREGYLEDPRDLGVAVALLPADGRNNDLGLAGEDK
jgi:O-antigen ligase